MADNRYVSNEVYYALFDEQELGTDVPQEISNSVDNFREDGLGYYQFVPVKDIIDEFMVMEVQEGMLAERASRTQVEYLAQRALQELSYDVITAKGTLEYDLSGTGGSLSIPLPQDLVSITKVSFLDDDGVYRPIQKRRYSGNPYSPMVDDDGAVVIGSDGEPLQMEESVAKTRYDEASRGAGNVREDSSFEAYEGRENEYQGGRYGLQPDISNYNGTYIVTDGAIQVDSTLSGKVFVVEYQSDGLKENFDEVKVHKFCEEAMHAYILWKLTRTSKMVGLGDKDRLRKEWFTQKRNAKIRLAPIKPIDLLMTLRNKAKWIQ